MYNAEALCEAAYPRSDERHSRETKRHAVRLVVFEARSYRSAGREVGASTQAVMRWVAEFEERIRLAGEASPEPDLSAPAGEVPDLPCEEYELEEPDSQGGPEQPGHRR